MKVAFDFSPIVENVYSGAHDFGSNLLLSLAENEDCPEFKLFYEEELGRQAKTVRSMLSTRFRLCPASGNKKFREFMWKYFSFPKLEKFTGKFDLYHSFYDLMPPNNNCPRLLTVQHLSRFCLPELYHGRGRKTLQRSVNNCDHIISTTDSMVGELIEYLNVPEEKISRIYLAPDPNLENLESELVEQAREVVAREVGSYCDYFTMLVSPDPRKNILTTLKAFLNSGFPPEFKLVIMGFLPRDAELRALIKKNSEQIILLGIVEDVIPFIASSRGLIYTSLYEGCCVPILNALRLGIPVVASDIPSMHEVGGEAVVYADPRSQNEISKAMIVLATDPDRVKVNKEAGFWHSLDFNWKKNAEETIAIYHEIAGC